MKLVRRSHQPTDHLPDTLHPVIRQIYADRGIKSAEQLALQVANMAHVEQLFQIEQAAEIIYQAMCQQQHITIIGDFDADGATSTALMHDGFNQLGYHHHDFLVPNRFKYGYGLTPEIVEVAAQQGTQLIITVDNGISCCAGVARAKALGLTVVVTDHHLPGEQLPAADAIVNPNQPECGFPSKALAGVGVAFYVMLALRKKCREQHWFEQRGLTEPNFANLLDLVAIGTVADVVPLDHNNRIFVDQGIKRIRAGKTRPGVQALIEVSGRKQSQLLASDIGFAIGPRINAAGRLEDMAYGINCLLAPTLDLARAMAVELDQLNKMRRDIELSMQQQAQAIIEQIVKNLNELPNAFTLYQPDWHQGVIGIVAGRIKEKFHRPTIVFAASDDENADDVLILKGSARSIEGLHIRDVLAQIDSQYPELIDKFGGHAMAAGLSISYQHYEKFQHIFEKTVTELLSEEALEQQIISDGELTTECLTREFAELLQSSGPYGQRFPEPLFDGYFQLIQQRIVGERHLKVVLALGEQLYDGIWFNIDVTQWPNPNVQWVQAAYQLDVNEYMGKRTLQLLIKQLWPQ